MFPPLLLLLALALLCLEIREVMEVFRRHAVLMMVLCLVVTLPMTVLGCNGASEGSSLMDESAIQDSFSEGVLDPSMWVLTSENDFAEKIVDVCDVDLTEAVDYRLRLRAGTTGTADDTVKYLGVRSIQRIDFREGKAISFDLDWNNQANGCYLTGGVYLCPVTTDANPKAESDWLAFQYIGVPPGKNARFQVASNSGDMLRFLFREGWPDEQRTGREIGNQHVEIVIDENGLKIMENGEELYTTEDHGIGFTEAYLYLQMSSHSNYPPREIYFDDIIVQDIS